VTTYWCPSCQKFFDEPGFCPFDGTSLQSASADGAETLPSMAMPAVAASVAASLPTEVPPALRTEAPGPDGPTAAPSYGRSAVAGAMPLIRPARDSGQAPAGRPASDSAQRPVMPAYRALSASESTGAAIQAIAGRLSEYDLLVGQVLDGRYHIERKLGEGGMGVVFAARHAVIERPLAIKVLKREVMRDTATIKRFVQEAKAASRIGHPNIVDVTDFGTTTDGLTYQVMEYIDGQTLGGALRDGAPFSPGRTVRVAAQLARALGAAHAKGIVHRDLKPENIFLLARDGRKDFVKIVDFGIAKVVPVDGTPIDGPRLTRAGAVFGTPEYMAPEQAAGRNDTDGRVDVYALGIIMYEMLTGRVPHRGDTMVRTLAMQMLDPIEPPSRVRVDGAIRPELEACLMKALAKKREHRYATMAELVADLEKATGTPLSEPVSASVSDGKAYALSPLPPGADPASLGGAMGPSASAMLAAGISVPVAPGDKASGVVAMPADPRPTERRLRDEPAFVSTAGSAHLFDALDEGTRPPIAPPSRWPLALGAAMVLAVGGVVLALYLRNRDAGPANEPIATAPIDAPAAPTTPDASTVVIDVPLDAAGPSPVLDAKPANDRRDARDVRPKRADAADSSVVPPDVRLTPRGMVAVKIITAPTGGAVYEGFTFKGTSQPTIELPYGAKAHLRCTLPGYEEGHVDVTFDGKTEVQVCMMKRIVRCVDDTPDRVGLKNPIDDCPDARPN
jgi:serine/threonine protein kinase